MHRLYDLFYTSAYYYYRVRGTLLEVYDADTGPEPTNRKDVSILVSSPDLKNWELDASRRLRISRLPVIPKFAFNTGDKILANAARDGGSV